MNPALTLVSQTARAIFLGAKNAEDVDVITTHAGNKTLIGIYDLRQFVDSMIANVAVLVGCPACGNTTANIRAAYTAALRHFRDAQWPHPGRKLQVQGFLQPHPPNSAGRMPEESDLVS